jgi:hypothetical protein
MYVLTSALEVKDQLTSRPLYPQEKSPRSIEYEAGYIQKRVQTRFRKEKSLHLAEIETRSSSLQPNRCTECTIPASVLPIQCKSPKSNFIETHFVISTVKREGGQDNVPYMLHKKGTTY